jgi:hypothetical protein
MRQIFSRNQEEFTKQKPNTIPTIAVIEEAQSVLQERGATSEPFVAWVKEGRKYDLGAVLITQQPGSIPAEILSQGDNWFIFHLLSASDLQNLKSANSHFSSDILSSLLNEPIRGQGIFWSSAASREYPIPVRIASFEKTVTLADPRYDRKAIETFATKLRARNAEIENQGAQLGKMSDAPRDEDEPEPTVPNEVVDVLAVQEQRAVDALKANQQLVSELRSKGVRYGTIQYHISKALEGAYEKPFGIAYKLVVPAVSAVLGVRNIDWETFRDADGKFVIRAKMK